MEIKDLVLPSINQFASDYTSGRLKTDNFFHYDLNDEKVYEKRYSELMNRQFYRTELSEAIREFMRPLEINERVHQNIEALKEAGTVAVVGGQQAGLLSGPLYTIHKAISVISLARQQEKALNKKVVPVFWIAGEDHDYQEVNHVYILKNGRPEKTSYPYYSAGKPMVSDIGLDYETAVSWVERIFESYGETDHTNALISGMKEILKNSRNFVDFFARLMHEWFKEYGLLLIDASDIRLRGLESGYFTTMIKKAPEITAAVLEQQEFIASEGYKKAIEMSGNAANLFYYDLTDKERSLLELDGRGGFTAPGQSFTEAELLHIAETGPEALSNNVVTRPLMQESVFPVLAFIAGPGEAAYWAELKKAFELFEMKMPPIVPRLNFTLVERPIAADLDDLGLSLEDVLTGKTDESLQQFIEKIKDENLENLYQHMLESVQKAHADFSSHALTIDAALEPLLKKNQELIQKQLEFIHDKADGANRMKYSIIIRKYERAAASLYPGNSPQERIWNPFYFLNKYPDLVQKLAEKDYEFNNKHKAVYL
ncbi:bacillithiol biosynthesis cysteine-adding enzyme BshC [Peribacillus kribbensis]|uniref:bacillithiol biosynthesis cysteine-adding enzyme BshC n=1 Tax=Peribacillus kribbensis TaxID=356658 RepID=UPI00040095E0|nr:bacillithiol biosynthesis cysteine-adding enzyme BshC [Peribacillus kribbensis]